MSDTINWLDHDSGNIRLIHPDDPKRDAHLAMGMDSKVEVLADIITVTAGYARELARKARDTRDTPDAPNEEE